MKTKRIPAFIVTVMLLMLSLTACEKSNLPEQAQAICGSWAYIHDQATEMAVFKKDGTAKYEGKDCTFTCDSQFVTLTDTDGATQKLRYTVDDEGIYLYTNTTYTFSGEGEPNGLIGEWICAEKKWSFAFTETNTFMEDGYFTGYYAIDTENSTFKLTYDDQFEDTVCYYQLEGNTLTIDYPWRMVKTTTK